MWALRWVRIVAPQAPPHGPRLLFGGVCLFEFILLPCKRRFQYYVHVRWLRRPGEGTTIPLPLCKTRVGKPARLLRGAVSIDIRSWVRRARVLQFKKKISTVASGTDLLVLGISLAIESDEMCVVHNKYIHMVRPVLNFGAAADCKNTNE